MKTAHETVTCSKDFLLALSNAIDGVLADHKTTGMQALAGLRYIISEAEKQMGMHSVHTTFSGGSEQGKSADIIPSLQTEDEVFTWMVQACDGEPSHELVCSAARYIAENTRLRCVFNYWDAAAQAGTSLDPTILAILKTMRKAINGDTDMPNRGGWPPNEVRQ